MDEKTVSLTLAFSFLVMSFSGIMLYIVPKGKIAYWADWEMFGLTKTDCGNIHITSMFLFLVAAIWHIYYNWKPLISYIKNEAKEITIFKKELLIAFFINLFFVAATLYELQPIQSLVDINEDIKYYWEKEYGTPPYNHAEESSLKSFTKRMGIELDAAVAALKEKNITLESPEQMLKDIAKKNALSPQQIYEIIKPKESSDTPKTSHTSDVPFLGQKTLQELADMGKIDLKKSLHYIRAKGFEATSQSKMREAADALGTTPFPLYGELKGLK